MNIDACYWERQQERSREQGYSGQRSQQTKPTTTSSTSTTPASTSKTQTRYWDQKTPKQKESPKSTTTSKPDLSAKLDSRGKLKEEERQRRKNKNLCMYCGGTGHSADSCPVKASSAKGRASTAVSENPPVKPKDSESEKKKD